MLYRTLILAGAALVAVSCSQKAPQKADDPLADSGRTLRTEHLLSSLQDIAHDGFYLFGHQDDPMYGVGWVGDSARSDVRSVCGDYPALIGFDLGHIETGDSVNLDGVSFEVMRQAIIRQFDKGGVVTLSWHVRNPLSGGTAWVADSLRDVETKTVEAVLKGGSQHQKFLSWLDVVAGFLNSLETPYGVRVPVIFRPWHEHTGSWFWWGQAHCSAEQYRALWRLTETRLREKGVTNVLYAYSPGTESDGDANRYLERYPGDEMIDILGLDTYCDSPVKDTAAVTRYKVTLDKHLAMICQVAGQHDKVAALTETGQGSLPSADWWTATLAPILARHPVAYALVWRNAHDIPGHFYAPYPGQQSASDFVRFYNDPKTLFLRDLNGIYIGRK